MIYDNELPILSSVELRVLGALIEKSKTTPEYYPLTLNALTTACNQKTSRYPVVDYDEETVVMALNNLKGLSLVATAVGGSSRSIKYKHNFTTVFETTEAELALLCLLFLRGPQTPGELNTNSNRLHEFSSLESVQLNLSKLATHKTPFIKELAKRPGQKEARYTHLFGEPILQDEEMQLAVEPARKHVSDIEIRLAVVEQELSIVKEELAKLTKELLG